MPLFIIFNNHSHSTIIQPFILHHSPRPVFFCILIASSLSKRRTTMPMHSNLQQADALPTPELRRTLLIPSSQKWHGRWREFFLQAVLFFGVLFTWGSCQEGPWRRDCEPEGWEEGDGGAAGYHSAPRAREIPRVGRAPTQKIRQSARKKSGGTVRPDWICMRVVPLESPLKWHQPL